MNKIKEYKHLERNKFLEVPLKHEYGQFYKIVLWENMTDKQKRLIDEEHDTEKKLIGVLGEL